MWLVNQDTEVAVKYGLHRLDRHYSRSWAVY